MKAHHLIIIFLIPLWLCGTLWAQPAAESPNTLPQALKIDLKRLEETWHVLDTCAGKIWAGWNNYKDVPFLFSYPNGMQLLVGHPSPIDGFDLVPGVEIGGKKVYLDSKNVVPVELTPPLTGGGGPIPFGKEETVKTVQIHLEPTRTPLPENKDERVFPGEEQILINIHELFHCYQKSIYTRPYGNLHYNTDANYAIYAEIEGLALEKAYLEPENEKSKEYLKDFIVARELKWKSMTDIQQQQESSEDFSEGTAVYAETMALELMKKGYQPLITKEEDPSYSGFKDIQILLEKKLKALRKSRAETMDSRGKCYDYGCFQALLLNRFLPEWQKIVQEKQQTQDEIIKNYLQLSPQESTTIAQQLKTKYDFEALSQKHTTLIKKRDDTYKQMQNLGGRKYIINFKPTREFFSIKPRGESYSLGLIWMYPLGIEPLRIQEVLLEVKETPIIQDQLYYIKWIDTETNPTGKGYEITSAKKEGEDTYIDAVFTTKGFVLKAPKIQVKDLPGRVKVTVLSKVKENK